ncbi:hypothetical protein ABPG75_004497 [Micractinium tetrahymenae]
MRTTLACSAQPSTSGRPCEAAAAVCARPGRRCQRIGAPAAWQQQRQQRRRRALVAAAADKPDWLRDLEETAHLDEVSARLLAGANGKPEVVQQRMRDELDAVHARIMGTKYGGEDAPVDVSFRSPVDQFSLWIWLELYRPPTAGDMELLQEVLNSWFLVGRLGGYNSTNLQVLYHQDEELEDLMYDTEDSGSMAATFHDMAPLESKGSWARFWLDMGTADELALDVLLNALSTLSREQLGIRQVVVGGQNEDWPTPKREEFLPEVTMDPLRGPLRRGGGFEEDEDEDDGYFP